MSGTKEGFQQVETSPQPSPERRGRSISSHLRGRMKEGVSFILEDKGGVSFILSPSQGENQRGGFRFGSVILIPSSQRLRLKDLVVLVASLC